ncbi:MAG: mannose-1-phosphate guanylyltransferase [Phycisphaeraceae bacterium]|nr:mannose-1-phosphate guanylyltransferase [Phycisphaeraceae bacterium]
MLAWPESRLRLDFKDLLMTNAAMIMAGGSGTRLWPMSRNALPKQLVRFLGGQSLLEIAFNRLEGVVPAEHRYICAGRIHRDAILGSIAGIDASRFLAEPVGRDTVNAVGFGAAVIGRDDPDAVMAVLTADHIIEPVEEFAMLLSKGFELARKRPDALITFGITPTEPATGYGYLELGPRIKGAGAESGAFAIKQFREKPPIEDAREFFHAGPESYLWNSGMFIWHTRTLMNCLERYEPQTHAGLMEIRRDWGTDRQEGTIERIYPTLKKTSVDYAVMEPAGRDPAVEVLAIPMPLRWLDVGSWPSFAQTCPRDEQDNALAAEHVLLDTRRTLVASSDPAHTITAIGCQDMLIIHTPDATLVCPRDRAEEIKKLHAEVGNKIGEHLL